MVAATVLYPVMYFNVPFLEELSRAYHLIHLPPKVKRLYIISGQYLIIIPPENVKNFVLRHLYQLSMNVNAPDKAFIINCQSATI